MTDHQRETAKKVSQEKITNKRARNKDEQNLHLVGSLAIQTHILFLASPEDLKCFQIYKFNYIRLLDETYLLKYLNYVNILRE